ncbi:MAG: DUF4360 domain-containing protein [Oligoflexales bacterium]
MSSILRSIILLYPLSVALMAQAQDAPNPGEIQIQGVTYDGIGCPQGSVGLDIAADAEAFTLIFDDYIVEQEGPGVNQRHCNLKVNFQPPVGWQFALFSVQVRGYANLDPGVVGVQKLRVNTQGPVLDVEMKVGGPLDDDYMVAEDALLQNIKWSKCQGAPEDIKVVSVTKVKGKPNSRGLLTVDSIDGSISQEYGLAWRKCGNTSASVQSICKAAGQRRNGKVKEFTGFAIGKNGQNVLQRAKAKALKKCQNRPNVSSCEIVNCQSGSAANF